jgi:hypothetical protein
MYIKWESTSPNQNLSLYSLFVEYFNADASSSDYVCCTPSCHSAGWQVDTAEKQLYWPYWGSLLFRPSPGCAVGKPLKNSVTLSMYRPRFEPGFSRIQLALYLFILITDTTTRHSKHRNNNNNNNNNNNKYVSTIPGNHEVKELQKTAILGTAHILRKVLM